MERICPHCLGDVVEVEELFRLRKTGLMAKVFDVTTYLTYEFGGKSYPSETYFMEGEPEYLGFFCRNCGEKLSEEDLKTLGLEDLL